MIKRSTLRTESFWLWRSDSGHPSSNGHTNWCLLASDSWLFPQMWSLADRGSWARLTLWKRNKPFSLIPQMLTEENYPKLTVAETHLEDWLLHFITVFTMKKFCGALLKKTWIGSSLQFIFSVNMTFHILDFFWQKIETLMYRFQHIYQVVYLFRTIFNIMKLQCWHTSMFLTMIWLVIDNKVLIKKQIFLVHHFSFQNLK